MIYCILYNNFLLLNFNNEVVKERKENNKMFNSKRTAFVKTVAWNLLMSLTTVPLLL